MTISIPTYKVQVQFERRSKIPADRVVNVYHFGAPSSALNGSDYGNLMNVIKDFYSACSNDLSAVFANGPDDIEVAFTKLTPERPPPGTGLGPPESVGTMGFSVAPTLNGYPSEVSWCFTLDGTVVTDSEGPPHGPRPAARKRNRKYLGPIAETVGQADTDTKEVRPSSGFRQRIVANVKNFLIDAALAKGWQLLTHSPTAWSVFPPISIWGDNAFDTQRRRGELPTVKEIQPAGRDIQQAFIDAHAKVGVEVVESELGGLIVLR